MPPRNLAAILVTLVLSLLCSAATTRHRYAALVAEAIQIVTDEWLEPVEPRQLFEYAMDGMLEKLDPYSEFIPPAKLQPFQESIEQQFGGIGIVIERDTSNQRIVVISTVVGGPAYRAGIQVGDVIVAVDGQPVHLMSYDEVRDRIRGAPGTSVRLTLRHSQDGHEREVSVERAVISVPSVLGDVRDAQGNWLFSLESYPRIGYIRIVTFGEKTVDELKAALARLPESADGLILDLRNNSGGLLSAAVQTCDLFLDEGVIVTTRGRNGTIRSTYAATPGTLVPKTLPIVVLINRYSASASEIVAACLQDHRRAAVAGERSWGKGTVQNLYPLEGGRSAIKLTVATYWRPSGQNIHREPNAPEEAAWGVRPDPGLEVKLTDEQLDRLVRLRQRRDVLGPVVATGPVASPSGLPGDHGPPADRTWEDIQLQRAVEYLLQQRTSVKNASTASQQE
ncbi:MAG: peptidase S41 [Pirellulaceae bacterium]|nr:MAG: peptidase S41 [Pirellulaceae bacterium]